MTDFKFSVQNTLGSPGKLLSTSKGRYLFYNPDHFIIFNAKLHSDGKEIWHGDLDLYVDLVKLIQLSKDYDKKLDVLTEQGHVALTVERGKVLLNEKYDEVVKVEDGVATLKHPMRKASYDELRPIKLEKPVKISKKFPTGDINLYFCHNKDTGETPLLNFFRDVAEQLGCPVKSLNVDKVYLTWEDYTKLWKIEKKYITEVVLAASDEYTKCKEFVWHWFNFSPRTFGVEYPEKLDDGYVYIVE